MAEKYIGLGASVTVVLKVLGLKRSGFYANRRKKLPRIKPGRKPPGFSFAADGTKVSDIEITDHLKDLRSDPFFRAEGGSKALAKYLRRDFKIFVDHKKVYRICKAHGLLLARGKKKKTKGLRRSRNHLVTRENQVWEFDIKYGWLHNEKRFFFVLAFIDVFSREIKAHFVGRSCKASDLRRTFADALSKIDKSSWEGLTIRSDNGSQMRSLEFRDYVNGLSLEHEFIPCRTPNKNAHIESFYSILDIHLEQQYLMDLEQAYRWVSEFIRLYNEDRIHGSLNMSPCEFRQRTENHHQREFSQAI